MSNGTTATAIHNAIRFMRLPSLFSKEYKWSSHQEFTRLPGMERLK